MAQNSYMKNLMDTKGNITDGNVFDQTSRSINQSVNYSENTIPLEPKFTSCNLMDIVNKMKKF